MKTNLYSLSTQQLSGVEEMVQAYAGLPRETVQGFKMCHE